MVFSSIQFLFFFLPIFLAVYYISPSKLRNMVLLIFSLIFYSWGEPVYILLLIFASVVGYMSGRLVERYADRIFIKRIVMISGVGCGIVLLGIFKYADFAINAVNAVFSLKIALPKLRLPIGISFFTFQIVGYTADVYMGRIKAEKSFIDFLTFICMFPQLIAGPIVRYQDISSALHNRKHSAEGFSYGIYRFTNGLIKKVVIADRLGVLWALIKGSDYSVLSGSVAWLGIICFTLQLYFDFSGYADMAIGMGSMIGFRYNENFDHPLYSRSITEFWRKWHISLSSWFRDYVYIPLGGNRKGVFRHIINILIVWVLTGLWHGAAWNFAVWGLYYGVILILEKYVWGRCLERLPSAVRYLYSAFIIVLGFAVFDIADISLLAQYLRALFFMTGASPVDSSFLYYAVNYKVVIAAALVFAAPTYRLVSAYVGNIQKLGIKRTLIFMGRALRVLTFLIAVSYMVSSAYSPFLYFRF